MRCNSIAVLLLLASCARHDAALRIDVSQLRKTLSLSHPADVLAEASALFSCDSGLHARFSLDLSEDVFSLHVPACGSADLALFVDRQARAGEASAVAAFRGHVALNAVKGNVDVSVPVVSVGELDVLNSDEACDLSVEHDGEAAYAEVAFLKDATKRIVLPAGTYSVGCGRAMAPSVVVAFAERAQLTLTPPPVTIAGKPTARLHGPADVYAGREQTFHAGHSTQATTFSWTRDGVSVCKDDPVCRLTPGEAAFVLRVVASTDGQSDEASLVVNPTPAPSGSSLVANAPSGDGGLVFLSASAAMSSEPPGSGDDIVPVPSCTLTFAPGPSGCSGLVVPPDFGACSSVKVVVQDIGCRGFDLTQLGARDLVLDLQQDLVATSPGDGLFVETTGNIVVLTHDRSVVVATPGAGAFAGLLAVSEFPLPGEVTNAVVSLIGARVDVVGGLRLLPNGPGAGSRGASSIVISGSGDVILRGAIDVSGTTQFGAGSVVVSARRLFLPAFAGAFVSSEQGAGGAVHIDAQSVYLSGGWQIAARGGSGAVGGNVSINAIAPGDASANLNGDINIDGGAGSNGGGSAGSLSCSVSCGAACALLFKSVLSANGGGAVLQAVPSQTGSGGDATFALNISGDAPALTSVDMHASLRGGACIDQGPFSANFAGGQGGSVVMRQVYSGPASSTPRQARARLSGSVDASGGGCLATSPAQPGFTSLIAGDGGALMSRQQGFDEASLLVGNFSFVAQGGPASALTGTLFAGRGGRVECSGEEVLVSDSALQLPGGDASGDGATRVQGGDGGSFSVQANALSVARSVLSLAGGDARETSDCVTLAPGRGGQFTHLLAAAGSWPSEFSLCAYPQGGVAPAPGGAVDMGAPATVITPAINPCP